MAQALVSIVLDQLASIGRQQVGGRIRLIAGAEQQVEKLHSNFVAIQAVLADAENRQVKENAVRDWLDKLKNISYDIDDALDEWNTKILLKEAENKYPSKPLKKVRTVVLHYLTCKSLVLRHKIAIRIKDLGRKLDIIAVDRERFYFRSITESSKEVERPMTTSIIDLTEIYGRDDDKNTILDLLLSQSSQQEILPIISLVGMGGIGKTTLARLVFNDNKVNTHFDKRVWVCVSEPFDELRIAKSILESLTNNAPNLNVLETVVQNIRRHIEGKKFLLVLDDIWTENSKDWDQLKHLFRCGSLESRILVTTRKENVANAIGTTKMISLGTLPIEKCWLLFSRIAFFGKTNEESNEFLEIGRKIVQKCKGLPLAVKTLASLLRYKRKFEEWQNILESEIWELEEVEQEVFRPLLLSCYDLHPALKKCFLYCATFPKDYEIKRAQLIRLWIAHGYVRSKPNKDIELVGEEYFETLAKRSFFQDFRENEADINIRSCKMHDIVHDLAQFLTQNECYTIEVDGTREYELPSSYDNVRHSMIKIPRGVSFPSSIYTRNTVLRSLMVECNYNTDPKIVLSKLVDQFTCLRSLFLRKCSIEEIPVEINKLIHLRYLDLSWNVNIKELPETLCGLYNLQTLDISNCINLVKLPQEMGNLLNLRHLLNWRCDSISSMPKSLERLTGLRTLGEFVTGDSSYGSKACSVECLKNFKHLRQITIPGLGNLTDVGKVRGIEFNKKKNLRYLRVFFDGRMNEKHEQLLEALQPPPNLEELVLQLYNGNTMFPHWMMSLTHLRKLLLLDCINCEQMPSLGKLSSLEILYIWNMYSVKRVDNKFLGIENDATSSSTSLSIFPKLKFLSFWGMIEWEEWNYEITKREDEEITAPNFMPSLKSLRISYCPKLMSLPIHLRQMTTLKIHIKGCSLLKEQRTYS